MFVLQKQSSDVRHVTADVGFTWPVLFLFPLPCSFVCFCVLFSAWNKNKGTLSSDV